MAPRKTLVLFLFLSWSATAVADGASELVKFRRCYSKLTRAALTKEHPVAARVLSEQVSAADACLEILGLAKLKNSEEGGTTVPFSDPIAARDSMRVLKTMNDFHRSWFPSNDIISSLPGGGCTAGTRNLFDEAEAALHVTRALFSENVPYSEVFTGKTSLYAKRSQGERSGPINIAMDGPTRTAPFVQFGDLLGIRKTSDEPPLFNLIMGTNRLGDEYYNKLLKEGKGASQVPIHGSFGAGILGTPSYLLVNYGRSTYTPADGGRILLRRWSRAILSDLLCRSLPVIRTGDARSWVVEQEIPGEKQPPFRKSVSCMQCHATIDSMAGTVRNLSPIPIPDEGDCGSYRSGVAFTKWISDLPKEKFLMPARDIDYSRRPPDGRIYFRDYQGRLIDKTVRGIVELGRELADLDDPYVCAASRYYTFLTGKSVTINDFPGAGEKIVPGSELELIVTAGQNLKKSQSLREMLRELLTRLGAAI